MSYPEFEDQGVGRDDLPNGEEEAEIANYHWFNKDLELIDNLLQQLDRKLESRNDDL